MGRRRNDDERRQWIENDEGPYWLYWQWKYSRQSMTRFIRENRQEIDIEIDTVLDGRKRLIT